MRFGVITGLEFLGLPDVVAAYRSRYPRVDLSLRMHPQGSTGLVADIRHGRLAVAVVSASRIETQPVAAHPLSERSFVLLVPADHRLAGRESVVPEDLADATFIDMPAGFGSREHIDAEFARCGLRRDVALEVPDQMALPSYVRTGLGIAVTHSTGAESQGVVRVPLEDVPPHPLSVIHRVCPPPTVAPMVKMLQAAMAAHEETAQDAGGRDSLVVSRPSRR